MNNTDYKIYEFPECESIVISGDIHGDFNLLVNKMCVQYSMENTLLIVAGDCGFGFENRGYYENIVKKNAKRMNNNNNWILFVRVHIPADTRSAFPVISVQSPVSIQCCWQS